MLERRRERGPLPGVGHGLLGSDVVRLLVEAPAAIRPRIDAYCAALRKIWGFRLRVCGLGVWGWGLAAGGSCREGEGWGSGFQSSIS